MIGVALVMMHGTELSGRMFIDRLGSNPAAYSLAFAAAIAWALYSNLARRWSAPGSHGAVELFIPITGLTLLLMRFLRGETTHWTGLAIGEVAALGMITVLAYVLWETAMRRGNLLLVATGSYFTPLLSTLVSCLYLKVTPGTRLWAGCVVLIAGSLLSWRSVSPPKFKASAVSRESGPAA